jgi:signal transduction histidine kinase
VAPEVNAPGEDSDLDQRLVGDFRAAGEEIEASRGPIQVRIREKDGRAAFWGDLARVAVAAIVPMGLVLIFREIVMRQYRQKELEMSLEAEQQLAKARDELVANTSHELRTPLTAISGLGQILEEDPRLPDDVREMLRMMNSESSDLARMVEDLLTTARLASGQLRFEPESVHAEEEADTVVRPFLQNGHSITVDVEDAELWVDRLRQRQVIRNLLSNAVKYGGDKLELRGFAGPQHYEWMVVDDGPGVPKELEARLFQRYVHSLTFQQAVAGGVGLGLSIVKSLAEGMGGTVDYRRVLGETIFSVRVPLKSDQGEVVEPRGELAATES